VQRLMMNKGFVPEGQGPAGVMGCVPG
jgi:hypothetical protein